MPKIRPSGHSQRGEILPLGARPDPVLSDSRRIPAVCHREHWDLNSLNPWRRVRIVRRQITTMGHCGVLLIVHTQQSELVPRQIRLPLDTAITRPAPPTLAPLLRGILSLPSAGTGRYLFPHAIPCPLRSRLELYLHIKALYDPRLCPTSP